MTGLSLSSAELEPRRKRALFRAWHRGIREMDLLLGRYAERHIATLTSAELALFEAMIELDDHDLYGWLTGRDPVPAEHDHAVFRAIRALGAETKPIGS